MREKEHILLREAFSFFKKRRFTEAILILEKIVSTESRSPYPYFLLSVSFLLSNRFSEADTIMNKLKQIDPEFLPFVQLESFLFIKATSSSNEALLKYIEKLEQFPNDKYLLKALKSLRRVKDFDSFQKNARLSDYVCIPKPPLRPLLYIRHKTSSSPKEQKDKRSGARISGRVVIIATIIIAVSIALAAVSYFAFRFADTGEKNGQGEHHLDAIGLDILRYDLIDKIKKNKPPIFYYSNKEVLKDFNDAKYAIKLKRYNDALIYINKISNSNANFRVVERVDFLRRFVLDQEDRDYSNISIQKVVRKPYLYRGTFIKWKGRIANLKRKDEKMFFNLLVDYKSDDIFAGIIDVYSEKDFKGLSNGDIVGLSAAFINTIGSDNRLYLVANDIQKR